MLTINSQAPDFTLPDQKGKSHTLSEYKGKYLLVYFYPKDDTSGCTAEACAIRDSYDIFEKEHIAVVGISKDSTESHAKFQEKYDLPFTLLSDPDKKVISIYGADGPVKRISYLIDPVGLVAKAYPKVVPSEHAQEIINDVRALSGHPSFN